MSEQEPEVKIVEQITFNKSVGDDTVDESETKTQPDSSQEEEKEDNDEKELESQETEEIKDEAEEDLESESEEKYGEVKRLPNETNREFALRIENAKLRDEVRGKQSKEIFVAAPQPIKKELSPERKKILEKYKPEDINTLKEVFDVMAEDMGFVRKEELGATSYQEKATEVLDTFLEKHPDYLPKNDPGNVLWNRFKEEYALYRTPTNTRDLKKILDKIHKDVFNIKPTTTLNKNEAANEKLKVASHSGSSKPGPSREGVRRNTNPQGLRTDMLKGFTDEEIAELSG